MRIHSQDSCFTLNCYSGISWHFLFQSVFYSEKGLIFSLLLLFYINNGRFWLVSESWNRNNYWNLPKLASFVDWYIIRSSHPNWGPTNLTLYIVPSDWFFCSMLLSCLLYHINDVVTAFFGCTHTVLSWMLDLLMDIIDANSPCWRLFGCNIILIIYYHTFCISGCLPFHLTFFAT